MEDQLFIEHESSADLIKVSNDEYWVYLTFYSKNGIYQPEELGRQEVFKLWKFLGNFLDQASMVGEFDDFIQKRVSEK